MSKPKTKHSMAKSRSIKDVFAVSSAQPSPAARTSIRKDLSKSMGDKPAMSTSDTNIGDVTPLDSAEEDPPPKAQRKTADKFMEDFAKNFERKMNASFKNMSQQLMAEINDLGQRISEMEDRLDDVENFCLEQRHSSDEFKDAIVALQLQTEDGENRSRRNNIRIRGIPENVQDVGAATTAIFQELVPNITTDRLEFDRAHRALSKIKPDGPPRDIVVKLHYYRTKEALMQAARDKASSGALTFQGSPYQMFSDISPATIARRREMKPNLAVLIANNISYKWGFPFRIMFQYNSKWYTASTAAALTDILTRLGLKIPTTTKRVREPSTPETPQYKKMSARTAVPAFQQEQTSESVDMG